MFQNQKKRLTVGLVSSFLAVSDKVRLTEVMSLEAALETPPTPLFPLPGLLPAPDGDPSKGSLNLANE